MSDQTEVTLRGSAHAGPLSLALRDLVDGLERWPLWVTIGWQDIKQRYRRSTLGPFWLTLSLGIMVAALGGLYAGLFKIPVSEYLPFLTLGLLAWGLISNLLVEGCSSFIGSEGFIKQIKLPFSTHVYRIVWRNLIIFLHNLVVYIPVALIFKLWPGSAMLLLIPALALVVVNAVWVGLLLGIICVRFRDIPPIVSALLQVAFLVTPILWQPSILSGRRYLIVTYNPFAHFVELMRAPLLGQLPSADSWIAVGLVTGVGWMVTLLLYVRFRHRIPYWV